MPGAFNPTPAEIKKRLLNVLHERAAAFMEEFHDDAAERRFDQAVNAVHDIAERNHVKLDTLSMLFPDGGK